MKKILEVIFITLLTICLTSCEGQKSAKSIIGHTYGLIKSSTSYVTIYFSRSGNATVNLKNDSQSYQTSHFEYDIKGDDVEIYYDYSDYWIETARGELYLHLTYDPIDDVLLYLGERMTRID